MVKRLDPIEMEFYNIRRKLILTNICLSSLHTYVMGFYYLFLIMETKNVPAFCSFLHTVLQIEN
jgi:hypothetical protein